MIDRDHLEQAGLHALGLLDESERAAFERECRVNPALQEALREADELVTAISATAPPHTPDPRNLELILGRISGGSPRRGTRMAGAAAWRAVRDSRLIPWAAAAVFAVLAIWFGWQGRSAGTRASTAGREDPVGPSHEQADTKRNGSEGRSSPRAHGDSLAGREAPNVADSAEAPRARFFPNRATHPEFRLRQDTARLRSELEKLRAVESARQQPPAGVSDLRLVEMRPPGTTSPAAKRELLSSRVADAIAAGLDVRSNPGTSTPADSTKPTGVTLSGQGANPAGDIAIENGMLDIGTLNLHPDAQVVHKNFPRDEDFARYGLTRLDQNTVWDGNGGLWHRSADGRTWIGQRVPANWQAPEPDEAPVPAPPLRPPPTRVDPSGSVDGAGASTEGIPGEPYALPILDHHGQGTLIVQNLPPPPEGMVYHLWLRDPRMAEPFSVGVLPPLDSPNDHFSFDLGTPGYVPTGYLLTVESPGPVEVPRGKIILQGP